LSYSSVALYLGIATGPVIGQALLGLGGFRLDWTETGLLVVLAALLATRVPESLRHDMLQRPGPLIHPVALVSQPWLFTGVAATSGLYPSHRCTRPVWGCTPGVWSSFSSAPWW
jgi:hypothetical protein